MNFFADLQHDYEEKASKWSVNFRGPDFDIPDGVKEDIALIGPMCEVKLNRILIFYILDHFKIVFNIFINRWLILKETKLKS